MYIKNDKQKELILELLVEKFTPQLGCYKRSVNGCREHRRPRGGGVKWGLPPPQTNFGVPTAFFFILSPHLK